VLQHAGDQELSEATATVLDFDVKIDDVGIGRAVGDRTSEPGLFA
jgi:hypothetical protein